MLIFTQMNPQNKILIVDDEPDILEILKYNFEKENYIVFTANNGVNAIKKAKKHLPDLIVLDMMMPEIDGIETCKQLRENTIFEDTIILFLTARNEEYSEVAAFDAGADDFVAKPIRPRTLIARVKTLLKRNKKSKKTASILEIASLKIDFEKRIVFKNNVEISLPKKEFQLLKLFVLSPDKVFTREEIFSAIWGNSIIVGDRTLDVHIRKLRKKIGENYIKTSKGVGYAFNSRID